MKSLRLILCILLFVGIAQAALPASDADQEALSLIDSFVTQYKALAIPDFEMSYLQNFTHIPTLDVIARQNDFFRRFRYLSGSIKRSALSDEVRYQFDELSYEIDFNCARLRLERQFRSKPVTATLPSSGLFSLPDGQQWYMLYIRRWGSKEVTPDQLLALGNSEITRVTGEMKSLQKQLGYEGRDAEFYRHLNASSFFITDEAGLKASLRTVRDTVQAHMGNDFEKVNVPTVDIRPVDKPTKDTPPGYYYKGVFYYSFFNNRFPERSREWLFLHEAMPGHHYQMEIGRLDANRPELRKLFWYPGFSEGWGAYVEDLGKDCGCYSDRYQYLGKWEWDLARSARVVIDVGIHYKGWTREQALSFWKEHIPNQDAIAEREIDRIIRWPAQVISYKVGEREILDLRDLAARHQGIAFSLPHFHRMVLQRGSIPLPVLHEIVEDGLRDSK
jgi:uncharacterized protein (DUF885 family)